MHNNTEIKRDIKNQFLYIFKAIYVLLYHKVSALWLVPAGRKSEECKILICTSYMIAQKVYIGMASTSVCVTTMVTCSTCPNFKDINQTHIKL